MQYFNGFDSTVWYVIITMTSVGYGNIIASTTLGRATTICVALTGALFLSLLVAIVTELFILGSKQEDALTRTDTE